LAALIGMLVVGPTGGAVAWLLSSACWWWGPLVAPLPLPPPLLLPLGSRRESSELPLQVFVLGGKCREGGGDCNSGADNGRSCSDTLLLFANIEEGEGSSSPRANPELLLLLPVAICSDTARLFSEDGGAPTPPPLTRAWPVGEWWASEADDQGERGRRCGVTTGDDDDDLSTASASKVDTDEVDLL